MDRKKELVAEAHTICNHRLKLLEQQQYDLAVKATHVEEAMNKAERVLAEEVTAQSRGDNQSFCVCVCVCVCPGVCECYLSNMLLPLLLMSL